MNAQLLLIAEALFEDKQGSTLVREVVVDRWGKLFVELSMV